MQRFWMIWLGFAMSVYDIGAIKLPRYSSSFAKMSMDQLTKALVDSNVSLFRKHTNGPNISSDVDLATTDRRDRYSVLPSITNIVNMDSDYLDEIWNWARGVGETSRSVLPYPLFTSVYLNVYGYSDRSNDPSDSYDPNVAGDIVINGNWSVSEPPYWDIWPDGTNVEFYFNFASEIPDSSCVRSTVLEAAARFFEATSGCTQFNEVSVMSPTALIITTADQQGCFSSLGYQGGSNNVLNLGVGCRNVGTVMHLLGHVLGLAHEDQRFDAADHVKIIDDNIDVLGMSSSSIADPTTTSKYQFTFKPLSGTNTQWEAISAKYPYEYGSLMHNPRYTYSVDIKNDQTITGKQSPQFDDLLGNRGYLTARDASVLNEMYSCQRLPPTVGERSFQVPLSTGLTYIALDQCLKNDAIAETSAQQVSEIGT